MAIDTKRYHPQSTAIIIILIQRYIKNIAHIPVYKNRSYYTIYIPLYHFAYVWYYIYAVLGLYYEAKMSQIDLCYILSRINLWTLHIDYKY